MKCEKHNVIHHELVKCALCADEEARTPLAIARAYGFAATAGSAFTMRGDIITCHTHGQTFPVGEQCSECRVTPMVVAGQIRVETGVVCGVHGAFVNHLTCPRCAEAKRKPQRQHVSDAAWEILEKLHGSTDRARHDEKWRPLGLMLVTVEEWDRRETLTEMFGAYDGRLKARALKALGGVREGEDIIEALIEAVELTPKGDDVQAQLSATQAELEQERKRSAALRRDAEVWREQCAAHTDTIVDQAQRMSALDLAYWRLRRGLKDFGPAYVALQNVMRNWR